MHASAAYLDDMQQGCLSPKSCDDRQLQTGEMIIDMIDAKIRAWYAYGMGTSVGTCGQQWPTRYEFEQGAKFNRWFRHSLATRAIPGQDLLLGFNIFYAAVFSIEAGMRLFVQGPLGYVWQHSDWAWNWLDMFAARHTCLARRWFRWGTIAAGLQGCTLKKRYSK